MNDGIGWLLMLLLFSACVEFRVSDQEAIETLEETSVAIQFGDLQVEDRNIHYAYTDNSKDLLVVFVHGSPGSWNAFIDYFKADSLLSSADFVSVDRAGFGLSGFGEAETSIEVQAKQIKAVTDQFNHSKILLVGHSLGGPVIARMAMDYPNAFDGLILVAPSIDPNLEEKYWYQRAIDSRVGGWLTPKEFEVSNDEILPLKGELELMLPLWDKIQIPSIVIQGTNDRLVPKGNADFAKAMLPDSLVEIRLLEGVNHFVPWNHPSEIIKAIQLLSDGFR